MITETQEGRQLLNEAAYAIIKERAPNELPLYVDIRDSYLEDPEHFLDTPEASDEALDLGIALTAVTFSYAAFVLLTPMLTVLVTELVKALGGQVGENIGDWLCDLFRGDTPPKAMPFSPLQLQQIQAELTQIGNEEAGRLGLSPVHVLAVRDALVSRLAVNDAQLV